MRGILLTLLFIISTSAQSQVVFNVPEIEVPVSEYINLPVEIETQGEDVGSLEFALNYDSDYLEFVSISVTTKAQEWLTYTMDWEGETVRWGGYDASFGIYTISNTTELFTIRFRVTNQDWDTIPITIGRKTAGTELGWDIEVLNTDGYVNKRMASFDTRPVDGIYGVVYPIPTKGMLTFDLTVPDNGDYEIRIISYSGVVYQKLKKRFFSGYVSFQTDLSNLNQGIYLLQITNGVFVKTFKIIKK
jgi:hypothetical protein